jgi:uncharacterized membrane protein YdjX (TVP38/TMEM64 family)
MCNVSTTDDVNPNGRRPDEDAVPHVGRRHAVRLAAMMITVAVAFVIATAALGNDPQAVRDFGTSLGVWGPIGYVAVCVVLTVALFPYPVQAAAAGLLFGVTLGTVYAVIAGTLGAVAAFSLARRCDSGFVYAVIPSRARRRLEQVTGHGFIAVLAIRLTPWVPRQIMNYLLALTPIGLFAFTAANLIGVPPYAYVYVALGGSLTRLDGTGLLLSIGGLLVLAAAVAPLLLHPRSNKPAS